MGEDYISRESMTISTFRCAYRQQAERHSPDELGDSDRTGHGGGVWYALSDTLDLRMMRWESRNEMESSKTRGQREGGIFGDDVASAKRAPANQRSLVLHLHLQLQQSMFRDAGGLFLFLLAASIAFFH